MIPESTPAGRPQRLRVGAKNGAQRDAIMVEW